MSSIALFEDHGIRRVRRSDEIWFSVVDVIEALEVSEHPSRYWTELRTKLGSEAGQPFDMIEKFKLPAADGKMRVADCATAKGIFRILQSVPSPKVEPFKQWLAKVAVERIEEEINPDLAIDRAIRNYRKRGWDQRRIEKRIKAIGRRHELTDEWKLRGVTDGRHYARLTDTTHSAAFGVTIKQHKHIKALRPNESFRDSFTDMEATLSLLAEEASIEITRDRDAQGVPQLQQAARDGGLVAAAARVAIEKTINRSVVTGERYTPKI